MNEKVALKSSHIFLDSKLVETVFKNIHYAYVTYVKTLAIREILIDNDLDMTDRVLEYEIVEKTNLIKVNM